MLCTIAISFFVDLEIKAQTVADENLSKSSELRKDSCYVGTLDSLLVNGKSYRSVSEVEFSFDGDTLKCNLPKIGRMPGSVYIEIRVSVDKETGVLTMESSDCELVLGIGMSLDVEEFEGTIIDDVLDISCRVSKSFLGLADFPVHFHFNGRERPHFIPLKEVEIKY